LLDPGKPRHQIGLAVSPEGCDCQEVHDGVEAEQCQDGDEKEVHGSVDREETSIVADLWVDGTQLTLVNLNKTWLCQHNFRLEALF